MRADNALLEQALRLLVATLSFDFVGTCLDESAEDLGTIQIPTAWRPAVEDAGTLQLLWGYYAGNEPPLSSLALESLVSGGMGGNGEGGFGGENAPRPCFTGSNLFPRGRVAHNYP